MFWHTCFPNPEKHTQTLFFYRNRKLLLGYKLNNNKTQHKPACVIFTFFFFFFKCTVATRVRKHSFSITFLLSRLQPTSPYHVKTMDLQIWMHFSSCNYVTSITRFCSHSPLGRFATPCPTKAATLAEPSLARTPAAICPLYAALRAPAGRLSPPLQTDQLGQGKGRGAPGAGRGQAGAHRHHPSGPTPPASPWHRNEEVASQPGGRVGSRAPAAPTRPFFVARPRPEVRTWWGRVVKTARS